MLGLPEKVSAHVEMGLDPFQIADWAEGCVTFAAKEVSQHDMIGRLHEHHLGTHSNSPEAEEKASARVEEAWQELDRRSECLGLASPYRVRGLRVERTKDWNQTPAFAFCLLAALVPVYRSSFRAFNSYTEQGEIFERVTEEALRALGWEVHRVGWSKSEASSIEKKVAEVAAFLGVASKEEAVQAWTAPKAKDAGLDLVCLYPFRDGWGGRPTIMTQCASGANWKDKLHTPEPETWKKLLDVETDLTRGLSMPFILPRDEFKHAGMRAGFSVLLDRHRLAVPRVPPTEWVSGALQAQIASWMNERVKVLLETAE